MINSLKYLGLLVALATTSLLAGCDLYFGNHGSGDTWNYCGSDGYYQCRGDNCTWVSSTCPSGGSGSGGSQGSGTGSGSGYGCTSSNDCAAGCYCQNGTCEEGGFCAQDSDCGPGYYCNTQRSSCEPNPTPPPPPPGCQSDSDCTGGAFCDLPTHTCTQGSCAGDVTCTTAAPVCPTGQVPLIYNGCYTGGCFETDMCSLPPVCKNINDETNCLNRSADCSATYTGLNCTKPDGTACHSGDANCTCQSFVFATCTSKGAAPRLIQNSQGELIDATPLMLH